ncbi:MAG: bifunctional glutamate N-acetyltransferase/amino-acid acetyltransferase ArgJ [Thermoflexaceae bacterium]|nr:bifunctional glutamate N-acetyltransferase/amino-acid acetyltransferase ArgJ [Thermoflexaceae bacterium]
MSLALDTSGSATSPQGFAAGATYAGIKTYGDGKLDLAILASDRLCTAAATFTKNRLHSAAIDVNRAHLADGKAQAVVVNSGVANSSTGARGIADARRMADLVARYLGIPPADVLVCSTGVIGHFLPMEKIEPGIDAIGLAPGAGPEFARAIMTTDTRPKHAALRFGPYTLGGCCKGSGMIHPNMATMLAFLTTDAPVEQGFLRRSLGRAVDLSFNLVSVDGDTSPSDTAILLANGAAGGETIGDGSAYAEEFAGALDALCIYLAKEIARDGEGATRVMDVTVRGAASESEARQLARELTTSYLLKSAVYGADPNWGRIVAVVGRSSVAVSEPHLAVTLCGHRVFEDERPTGFDPDRVAAAMRGDTVTIEVDLGVGEGMANGWGCDLTEDYVKINADYHT